MRPEIVPFVLIRPGETRMIQIARFAPDSGDTINRDISTPEVSRPRFLPKRVCGGCTSGLVR